MQEARAQWRAAEKEERMGGGSCWALEIVSQKGKWTKEKKDMQTEFQKQKNETQPSHVFAKSLGLMQTVLSVFFSYYTGRQYRCS